MKPQISTVHLLKMFSLHLMIPSLAPPPTLYKSTHSYEPLPPANTPSQSLPPYIQYM